MPRTSNSANTTIHSLTFNQHNLSLLTYFCFAVLLAALTQPAHAANPIAGRYLYVVDSNVAQVEGFSINMITGALKSLGACANLPVGLKPVSDAVDHTGSYLYVADAGGVGAPGQIFGFTIVPLTGCLARIGAWPTVGTNPEAVHITKDDNYVYVSDVNAGAANVEGFQILPGGILAHMAGTPFAYGANQGGLAVDSVGPYLFAADDSPAGPIVAFNTAGLPVPALPAFACATGTVTPNPVEMSVGPAGQDMLVLSGGGITLDSYTINRTTGCLKWVNTLALPLDGHSVYADPFGRYGYVTSSAAATVQPVSISPAGVVANILPALLEPAGSAPARVVVDPWGDFVYISLFGTNQIDAYKITANTGKLVHIGLVPTFVPLGGPTAIHAVTP